MPELTDKQTRTLYKNSGKVIARITKILKMIT